MATSNLALCYEGIQRTYRNALVGHIRKVFVEKHPSDFAQKLKRPFQKEWDEMTASAFERRSTGELSAEIKDEFDLLGVNHFFNLFDAYYEDLCPEPAQPDEKQRKANKQALLQWLRTVKNLRDPLSHPSEVDFSYEDSFILLDCARRVLLRLNLADQAAQMRLLQERLVGRPLRVEKVKEPLEDRLPPRESIVVDFVGRKEELKLLWNWFEDPVSRRWILAGEGGKGKSALAYTFAAEVKFAAPEPYQLVTWMSAKQRRFREGKPVPIPSPDFHNMDSALSYILECYGWLEETDLPAEGKHDRVLELLNEFPALIVVDDVDSLEGKDEAVIEFFAFTVGKTKSKVLLTTRRQPFGLAASATHIGGLRDPDAEEFVRSRCRLIGIGPGVITPQHAKEIISITEASPLYMEDLLRFVAIVPPAEAIKEWKEKRGDAARKYALEREWELLSQEAKEVLLSACVSSQPVSFAELEVITGLQKDVVMSSIGELQRLFLVPKPRLIEGEQRFDININTRTLVLNAMKATDLYRRAEEAYKAGVKGIPRVARPKIASIVRQAVFLVKSGEQGQAEQLLCKALERFPNNPDLMGFLGWVYKAHEPPRIADARANFQRAAQLKCNDEGMYKHWARMEMDQYEWTKAGEAAEKGMGMLPESRLLTFLAGKARSMLGKELLSGFHKERAREELDKAKEHLEKALRTPEELDVGERRLNAEIYRALVLNSEALFDSESMAKYFAVWMAEHPEDPDAVSEWGRLSRKFNLGHDPRSSRSTD